MQKQITATDEAGNTFIKTVELVVVSDTICVSFSDVPTKWPYESFLKKEAIGFNNFNIDLTGKYHKGHQTWVGYKDLIKTLTGLEPRR